MTAPTVGSPRHEVPFRTALRVWLRIGLLSFGGPAGQIALMHRELVEERRWISEERFLHALNYCMLLPGPEAQQLATYIGWLLHRTWGGLVAGVLFVLPGACLILALSTLYARFHELPTVAAIFFGVKAAVLAIVMDAVVRVARRAIKSRLLMMVALAAFLAIFAFHVPFPLIIVGAALVGVLAHRVDPALIARAPNGSGSGAGDDSVVDRLFASGQLVHAQPNAGRAMRVLAVGLALWFGPIAAIAMWKGVHSVFVEQGVFFSQAAVVTFGGAYSVLSYVAQRAVEDFAWLRPGEMIDGLALAETTPGPLILVLQFVAYLGAYRAPGDFAPMTAGLIGSAIALWTTFVPCFIWILAGAPYVEALRRVQVLSAALASITAAVVGVILNLSVWFAMHALFGSVDVFSWGPVHVDMPDPSTLRLPALVLTLGAAIAIWRFKVGIVPTLLGSGLLGLAWSLR